MAPSASMLFLSYHQLQLHQPAAVEEATPRKEAAAAGSFRRLSLLSNVLSIPMFEQRREAAAAAPAAVRQRDAGEDIKSAAANKELEEKFEEALRLSCWSS